MDAVQTANAARTDKAVPTGWCSWYHFFEQVLCYTSS
jgi:alpha-galactosidase